MLRDNNITAGSCVIEACYLNFSSSPISAYVDLPLWTSLVLVCIIGVPINFAVAYYDWYGGDPQKRSLGNRIISVGSLANIFSTLCCFLLAVFIRYKFFNKVSKNIM